MMSISRNQLVVLTSVLVSGSALAGPVALTGGGSISANGLTIISIGQPCIGLTFSASVTMDLGIVPCLIAGQCPADFNADGVLDFFDYLDFVADFAANNARSDFNHDNILDFFDYLDFVQAFAAGCP